MQIVEPILTTSDTNRMFTIRHHITEGFDQYTILSRSRNQTIIIRRIFLLQQKLAEPAFHSSCPADRLIFLSHKVPSTDFHPVFVFLIIVSGVDDIPFTVFILLDSLFGSRLLGSRTSLGRFGNSSFLAGCLYLAKHPVVGLRKMGRLRIIVALEGKI